jgi:hypothetical protein
MTASTSHPHVAFLAMNSSTQGLRDEHLLDLDAIRLRERAIALHTVGGNRFYRPDEWSVMPTTLTDGRRAWLSIYESAAELDIVAWPSERDARTHAESLYTSLDDACDTFDAIEDVA